MSRASRPQSATEGGSYHRIPGERPPPPSGCPVLEDWDPFSTEYLDDPYAVARELRERYPIFYAAVAAILTYMGVGRLLAREKDISTAGFKRFWRAKYDRVHDR